jgi:type I restriction enzyme M protein
MVHQLDDNGTMAIVFPTGFVSWCRRSHTPVFNKREELPRCRDWYACQYFLRNEYPDLYFGLEEKRTDANSILFIDASQHFEKVKTQNVLRKEDIDKIISTFENRTEEDKYSHLAH